MKKTELKNLSIENLYLLLEDNKDELKMNISKKEIKRIEKENLIIEQLIFEKENINK